MMPWPAGGEMKDVSGELDSSVGSVAFSPDSRTIFVTAEDAGLEKVFALPAEGGKPVAASNTATGVYSGVQSPVRASGTFLTGLWSSAVSPAEVVRIDPQTRTHRLLTQVNTANAAAIAAASC